MKFLYQPVSPWHVTQKFGENSACYDTKLKKVVYCNGKNPPPGLKSLYGSEGHTGLDIRAKHGQEVYCACAGEIEYIDTQPRSGLDVRIISKVGNDVYRHIYEHLLGYQGKVGDFKEAGQLIGWADNTGWSSGDHLHFQLEKRVNGQWVAVDPAPHLNNEYARNHLLKVSIIKWLKEIIAKHADNFGDKLRK